LPQSYQPIGHDPDKQGRDKNVTSRPLIQQPACHPFIPSRTQRFADNITPTATSPIPASAVWVGNTVYSVASPNNEKAVAMPTAHNTRRVETIGFTIVD
jgi:hypothetical protein